MDEKIPLSEKEFKALSAQNRIEILKSLKNRNCNLTELSNRLQISIPSVQKHLDKLVESGLIQRIKDNRKWAYYTLTSKGKKIVEPDNARFFVLVSIAVIIALGTVAMVWISQTPGLIDQPEILKLNYNSQNQSIELSWKAASQGGVLYEVQRKLTSEKEFAPLQSALSKTEYADSAVQANQTYEYRVLAYRTDPKLGWVSKASTPRQITVPKQDSENAQPENSNSPENTGNDSENSNPGDSNPSGENPEENPSLETSPASDSIIILQAVLLGSEPGIVGQTIETNAGNETITIQKSEGKAVLLYWTTQGIENASFEIEFLDAGESWQTLATGITGTYFLDASLETGQPRTYQVRALQNGAEITSNTQSVVG